MGPSNAEQSKDRKRIAARLRSIAVVIERGTLHMADVRAIEQGTDLLAFLDT